MSTVNVQNKMWPEERENGWLTTMPTKHKNLNFHNFNIVPFCYTVHRWTHVYKKILRRF